MDVFTCPQCEETFEECNAETIIKNMVYDRNDNTIYTTILVYCPECSNVVILVYDTMRCKV